MANAAIKMKNNYVFYVQGRGTVESDGRGCNLDLHADSAETFELLERRRGDVREELEGTALPVRFIGISRSVVERLRNRLLSGRGLDLTV